MTERGTAVESALLGRLRAAADILDPEVDGPVPRGSSTPPDAPGGGGGTGLDASADALAAAALLDRLLGLVGTDAQRLWLVIVAACAAFPSRDDFDRIRRRVELAEEPVRLLAFLDASRALAGAGSSRAHLEIVVDGVLVDVDHTATSDLHTGIQRVSRNLLPHWVRDHGVIPVAWDAGGAALRRLTPQETGRVLDWSREKLRTLAGPTAGTARAARTIVAPWGGVVVMTEVATGVSADRLACLGQRASTALTAVVYDTIPIVSADTVPPEESTKFVRYLVAVKFADRVAAISNSAAEEFSGFIQALTAQGLPGPSVHAVPLGSSVLTQDLLPRTGRSTRPTVLVVGSHEPRKNHLAVLHSAETLWREGLDFSVDFIGGSGWGDHFPRRVTELQRQGRPVTVRRAVSDEELDRTYRDATFTVFPSLHEGYGLPVVESLAHGTPVITANHGATAEAGSDGGTVLIDPRDDTALTDAMRHLLTSPDAVSRLVEEIADRPRRDWVAYADDLWDVLVAPSRGPDTGSGVGAAPQREKDTVDDPRPH